jgi:hypothetical protein
MQDAIASSSLQYNDRRGTVYSAEVAVGRERFPRGWVEWIKPYLGWFSLIYILTSLLCGAMNWNWHLDFHLHESSSEPNVTITASGFIGISPEILDNSNTVRIISHSSVPVDAVVKAGDGHDLFAYLGLMPGESFCFECGGSCTVVASAS